MIEVLDMSNGHEHETIRNVSVFVLLDLDRTLLNTNKLNELLCRYIKKDADTSPQDGDPYEYTLSKEGESFSMVPYLK